MAWAIVAVVLIAVAGVGWYVLRSTPSAADLQAASSKGPVLPPGTVQRTDTEGHTTVVVGPSGAPGGRMMTEDEAKAWAAAHPIETRGAVAIASR